MRGNALDLDSIHGRNPLRRSQSSILPNADASHAGVDAEMDARGFFAGQARVGGGLCHAGDDGYEIFAHRIRILFRQARAEQQNILVRHGAPHGACFA